MNKTICLYNNLPFAIYGNTVSTVEIEKPQGIKVVGITLGIQTKIKTKPVPSKLSTDDEMHYDEDSRASTNGAAQTKNWST